MCIIVGAQIKRIHVKKDMVLLPRGRLFESPQLPNTQFLRAGRVSRVYPTGKGLKGTMP
jgi:hypothetical protein